MARSVGTLVKSETTLKKIRVSSSLKVCEDMNVAKPVDTYRRHLRGGYGYQFKKAYESTLARPALPLAEWTECHVGVQAKAKLKRRALRHVLTTSTTITAFAKTRQPE